MEFSAKISSEWAMWCVCETKCTFTCIWILSYFIHLQNGTSGGRDDERIERMENGSAKWKIWSNFPSSAGVWSRRTYDDIKFIITNALTAYMHTLLRSRAAAAARQHVYVMKLPFGVTGDGARSLHTINNNIKSYDCNGAYNVLDLAFGQLFVGSHRHRRRWTSMRSQSRWRQCSVISW